MSEQNNITFLLHLNNFLVISFLLFINQINISFCSTCSKDNSIFYKTCFNDILIFNNKKYRAGHFVTYKNGDMIAEFSDDGPLGDNAAGYARIFYGLKSNGRYYFPNETPTWEIENIGNIDGNYGRYESLNYIVVTEDDLTKENEFIFSTSSYDSLTELLIMKNKTYIYTKTTDFMGHLIYSFTYSIVIIIINNFSYIIIIINIIKTKRFKSKFFYINAISITLIRICESNKIKYFIIIINFNNRISK